MKKAYNSPAMQELTMDLRSAVAELTGNAGDNHIGSGGKDDEGLDPDANTRNSWDRFWDDRE